VARRCGSEELRVDDYVVKSALKLASLGLASACIALVFVVWNSSRSYFFFPFYIKRIQRCLRDTPMQADKYQYYLYLSIASTTSQRILRVLLHPFSRLLSTRIAQSTVGP
jgi:hypothetical protein